MSERNKENGPASGNRENVMYSANEADFLKSKGIERHSELCFYDMSNPSCAEDSSQNTEEDVPVLRLERFTSAPFVNFENVKVGKAKVTCLVVLNPSCDEQEIALEKFPSEKGWYILFYYLYYCYDLN